MRNSTLIEIEMRPTLHEYAIQELKEEGYMAADTVLFYAHLTNRAPRLGDFVPCDDGGNVLQKPEGYDKWLLEDYYTEVETSWIRDCSKYQTAKDKVIFSGDWEVVQSFESHTIIQNENGVRIIFVGKEVSIGSKGINRIEDLPREIEFKEGVI